MIFWPQDNKLITSKLGSMFQIKKKNYIIVCTLLPHNLRHNVRVLLKNIKINFKRGRLFEY